MDRSGDEALALEVQGLKGLNIEALRAEWGRRFNAPPPALRGPELMRRALADRIQSEALGRDLELEKKIEALVRSQRRGETPKAPKSTFRVGTVLVREHRGKIHRVEVLAQGFLWDGARYASLSEIARGITGVRWNGPRFFGLREPKPAGPRS